MSIFDGEKRDNTSKTAIAIGDAATHLPKNDIRSTDSAANTDIDTDAGHSEAQATLIETDWNEEWMALQTRRRASADPAWWDGRATHFRPRETSAYARDFIELAQLEPGESVLDMGCGAGALALPLARGGHPVIACDFSPRMLEVLAEGIAHEEQRGIIGHGSVIPRRLAWDEDWETAGIAPKSVDVTFASRSIATRDLAAALMKLDAVARRRCCITLVTGASPRVDRTIMDAIGVSVTESRDFVYAFNILVGLGRLPEVRYIVSPRRDTFDTLEEGVADFARMLEGGNEDRIDELASYLKQHMVENPDVGKPGQKGRPQGRYTLDHKRIIRWAFISWEPSER